MPGGLSIASLAHKVSGLSGWRRRLAAFAAGAASVLALAPFFIWPVLWITLPVLLWLLDGAFAQDSRAIGARWYRRPAVAGAEIGWWFGFGYFLAGLFWVGEAFLVEAETFGFLAPVAVLLLPAGLAFFYAGAAALAGPFWRTGPWRVLALALALSAMEWLRGSRDLGVPVERARLRAHLSRVAHAERGRLRHLWADPDCSSHFHSARRPVVRAATSPRAPHRAERCAGAALRCRRAGPGSGRARRAAASCGSDDPDRAAERAPAREVASGEPAADIS